MKIRTSLLIAALVTALASGAHAASAFADAHLVYYWDFDGETTGYVSPSGTGLNAVTNEGPITYVAGAGLTGANATDKAASFNKSDFYLTTTGLDYSNFSVSLHVNTTSTTAFRDYISIGTSAATQFYLESSNAGAPTGQTGGGLSLFFSGTPGGAAPTASIAASPFANLNDGAWHHIGMTSDGNLLKLYVNGTNVGSTAYTGEGAIGLFQAASRLGDNVRQIIAAEDDISIWNTALSGDQMQFLSTNVATMIPEPSSLALLGLGSLALLRRRRRA